MLDKKEHNKILILGGAGFIGCNLTRRLVEDGRDVRVFTRSGRSIKNLADVLDKIELVYGDFMDEVSLKNAVSGVDQVVHLISTTFPGTAVDSGIYDIFSNLIPTVRLMEACVTQSVSSIVYLSSGGTIYGEPKSVPITENQPLEPKSMYGQSKHAIESHIRFYARTHGLQTQILRVSNPFGPYQNPYGAQGLISVALACALEDRVFRVYGTGEAIRDYLFIDDLIAGILSAMHVKGSHVMNISSNTGKTIMEVLDAIQQASGTNLQLEHIDQRTGDVSVSVLCNKRAREILSWAPVWEFEDAIQVTWDWVKREVSHRNS